MPDNVDSTPEHTADPTPAGQASDGAPKKEAGEDLRALLTEQREKLARMEQLVTNQRSLHDRQIAKLQRELQVATNRPRRYDEDEYEPPQRPERSGLDPIVEDIRRQQEILSFKTDNPDWQKNWEAVLQLLGDENQAALVSAYKKLGDETVLDYYKSYHNALREVKLRRMEQTEAAAEKARNEAEAKKVAQKKAGTISGVGASDVDLETLDIDTMTSEEMMRRGLVRTDPNDPPRIGLIP